MAVSARGAMLITVLIGFLVLSGISLMVLDAAIEHAAEGHEDESGFHQDSREWPAEPTSTEAGVSIWDQMEGACCPLDMRPTFRPIVSAPFERRQQ